MSSVNQRMIKLAQPQVSVLSGPQLSLSLSVCVCVCVCVCLSVLSMMMSLLNVTSAVPLLVHIWFDMFVEQKQTWNNPLNFMYI